MARRSKETIDRELYYILNGLKKHAPNIDTFTLGGAAYTREELVAIFQSPLDAASATQSARNAWLFAARSEAAIRAKANAVRNLFKLHVANQYGEDSAMMRHFGFRPKVTKKPTVDARLEAVQKREATRALRGTKGKRQRAKIKGEPPKGAGEG